MNPEIERIFRECNIDYSKGMACLLMIYYDIPITGELENVLHDTLMQINVTKILDKDIITDSIVWNVSLFAGVESEWEWVNKEYRPLFSAINKVRAGSPSSCLKRMKDFFSKHPEVRKEDIIEAAKMYIRTVRDPAYLQGADYFIKKDKGSDTTSRLEQFLEILKESRPKADTHKMARDL